ncbi:MAG: hypothetical protein WD871_01830 [Xanthobacteraceae bacterium]
MLLDPVIARVKQAAPALGGRVEGAAELSALVKSNALPQVTPASFVLPNGLRGGAADAVTGLFRQQLDEVVSVVLIVRVAGDRTGAGALPTIDTVIGQVVNAVCGWAPAGQIGVFRLSAGRLVSLNAGAVIYQLDFAIADQLRIAS